MFSAASKTDNVSSAANYIEDVFSTYLYTGNASTQNIVNGIDLAGKGGMVWGKTRNDTTRHVLFDTERGVLNEISSNLTAAQTNHAASLTAFNSNGYTLGNDDWTNYSTTFNSVSWTFRKQPKFFDVVTYTGTGSSLTVSHNLGSTPGCIIIKNYNPGNTDWTVYHRSLGTGAYLQLNNTNASVGSTAVSAVSSTTFTVAGGSANWNSSGQSYVAYLFAHDAGGFGTAGTDNVISCGAFTTDSIGSATVNLGYEAQWILIKRADVNAGQRFWFLTDIMRGLSVQTSGTTSNTAYLTAETSNSESLGSVAFPTATGFRADSLNNDANYIYIAIRRGPMKTPTSGTSVFLPQLYTGTNSNTTFSGVTNAFQYDSLITRGRTNSGGYSGLGYWVSKLQKMGTSTGEYSAGIGIASQNAELSNAGLGVFSNTGYFATAQTSLNYGGDTYVNYWFKRAPGFMDVVVTPGIGSSNHAIPHNLRVVPELIIAKDRNYSGANWVAYSAATGQSQYLVLNLNNSAASNTNIWGSSAFTSSTFYVNDGLWCAVTGDSGVFYLFASCPGVSKVGSYSGTGATQTISCGFAARFVIIKRTDSTGDWWVWDTSRGMVAGTDPRLALNSTNTETNANWVYTDASGFQIVTTDATVNASGGSYIYLAIA